MKAASTFLAVKAAAAVVIVAVAIVVVVVVVVVKRSPVHHQWEANARRIGPQVPRGSKLLLHKQPQLQLQAKKD